MNNQSKVFVGNSDNAFLNCSKYKQNPILHSLHSQNDNKILHNEAAHHVGLQDMRLKYMLENIINK